MFFYVYVTAHVLESASGRGAVLGAAFLCIRHGGPLKRGMFAGDIGASSSKKTPRASQNARGIVFLSRQIGHYRISATLIVSQ